MHGNVRPIRAYARKSERLPVVLPARVRSRSGFLDRVVITDLSPEGCRIESQGLTVHAGDLVVIRPQSLEGLTGVVRWVVGHTAGVQFDRPLYGPVVDHLFRNHFDFLASIRNQENCGMRLVA
jgi:hypothetical protein